MADATAVTSIASIISSTDLGSIVTPVLVAMVTSIGTYFVARVNLRKQIITAAEQSYENRHDALMLADAEDRRVFREQLMSRVDELQKQLAKCTEAHAKANVITGEQQQLIFTLQRDLDRVVARVNELGRVSQFADLTDIPGLKRKPT